jgi:hypothetical protein
MKTRVRASACASHTSITGDGTQGTLYLYDKPPGDQTGSDCLFGEFSAACEAAEVIEETVVSDGLKELVLTLAWRRPLHVVVIVDEVHQEDRVVTVYEPEPACWSTDFRRRR